MTEGTSSTSHAWRARGGGEASLKKRTLCPRPLIDAQTHAWSCSWACVVLKCTLVILPALLAALCGGWTVGREGGRPRGEERSECMAEGLHCLPLNSDLSLAQSYTSPDTARQTHRCMASEGGAGLALVGWTALSSPPSIIIHSLLTPFFVILSSWSLTAPSTHPHTPCTGFLVLFSRSYRWGRSSEVSVRSQRKGGKEGGREGEERGRRGAAVQSLCWLEMRQRHVCVRGREKCTVYVVRDRGRKCVERTPKCIDCSALLLPFLTPSPLPPSLPSLPLLLACRKGKGGIFKSHTKLNKNPVKLRKLDYAEKHGYGGGRTEGREGVKENDVESRRERVAAWMLACRVGW